MRERDRGYPLASSSTLNRLELGMPDEAGEHRYTRIVADVDAIDRLMAAISLEARDTVPGEFVVFDIDATNDPFHSHQEGRFFHGYYDCYCSLPMSITCGDHVLCIRLRSSNVNASGSLKELTRIVGQIRASWSTTRVLVRGDSEFCCEELMAWCEAKDLDDVFSLTRSPRLVARGEKQQSECRGELNNTLNMRLELQGRYHQ